MLRTDKFKVTGQQSTLTDTEKNPASQKFLLEAINFMMGSDIRVSGVAEYSPKQASHITIDGIEKWNAEQDKIYDVKLASDNDLREDPRNNWSQNSLNKFDVAYQAFINIEKKHSQPEIIKKILGSKLNLEPIGCVWNMISLNYKFLNKQLNFYLRTSGPYSSIRLNRNGLKFSLVFDTQIYTYLDPAACINYELNDEGKPQRIPDHRSSRSAIDPKLGKMFFILFDMRKQAFFELENQNNSSNKTRFIDSRVCDLDFALFDKESNLFFMQCQGELIRILDPRKNNSIEPDSKIVPKSVINMILPKKIANLTVEVELDFNDISLDNQIPKASIEVSVSSEHKDFVYHGPITGQEILQIQNSSFQQKNQREILAFATPDLAPFAVALNHIATGTAEIFRLLQEISLGSLNNFENLKKYKNYENFLNSILKLFNEAARVNVFKQKIARMHQGNNLDIDMLQGFSLIQAVIRSGINIDDLLVRTHSELSIIFFQIKSEDFTKIINTFWSSSSPVLKVREAAFFCAQHAAEIFKNEGQPRGGGEDTIEKISKALFTAIDSIKLVLDRVAVERGFQLLGYQKPASYTNVYSIHQEIPFFILYLKSLQDSNHNNSLLYSEATAFLNAQMPVVESTLVFKSNSNNSYYSQKSSLDRENQVVLRHVGVTRSFWKIAFRAGGPEKLAALLIRNPFVKGVNDGLYIHASFQLFLTLFPDQSERAAPYLVITDIVGGLVGAAIGRYAILNPKKPMNAPIRIWESSTDGLVVFISLLDGAIRLYLNRHPDVENVSHAVFWGQIASGPLLFAMTYAFWNSVSPATKSNFLSKNACLKIGKTGFDMITKLFLYTGVCQYTADKVFQVPNTLASDIVPVIPAVMMTGLSQTRFKERAHGVMTYLISMNLLYTFINDTIQVLELKNDSEGLDEGYEISTTIRCAFWSILSLGSLYFVMKNAFKFVETYEQDPEIIVEKRKKNNINEEREDSLGVVMDGKEYQQLINPGEEKGESLTWLKNKFFQKRSVSDDSANNDFSKKIKKCFC